MKYKIIFLSFITLLFIAADCSDYGDKEAVYLPQDFLDYVYFPPGSYWIYQDSVTNETDSIYLNDCHIVVYHNNFADFKYEKMTQNFSYNDEQIIATTAIYTTVYEYNGFGYFIDINKESPKVERRYIGTYDSLKVNDTWYSHVVCVTEYDNYYYYWVKNIGMVKRVKLQDSTILELKSYHIND
jgi:hypothetical protein